MGRKLLALVVLVAALAGCDAKVETRFDVRSQTEATVSASLTFDPEATRGVDDRQGLHEQIVDTITRRVGVRPDVERDGGELTYRVPLRYDQLQSLSDLLGVAAASIGPGPDGEGVALTVALVKPVALVRAIDQGVDDLPDGHALAATLKGSLRIAVGAHYAGGIDDVRFADRDGKPVGLRVERTGTTVSASQVLSEFRDGTLVIVGEPDISLQEKIIGWIWPWGVLGAGIIAIVWWALADRRR